MAWPEHQREAGESGARRRRGVNGAAAGSLSFVECGRGEWSKARGYTKRASSGRRYCNVICNEIIAMLICGACERTLPDDSYSGEQRRLRQSVRRCEECVAGGNQLVLMTKGRTRSEGDECPICNLLLPLDAGQSSFKACCMKLVCDGCILAARKRGMRDCPFCRAPVPTDASQGLAMIQKRADVGDPMAIWHLGTKYRYGLLGLEKDVTRAVELYERAAELGLKDAHYNLGCLYDEGIDVEKDTAKVIRHYEAAVVKGDVLSRNNLGCVENELGNHDLALQHFLIAAKLGSQHSLNDIKDMFVKGLATKAVYAEALRGYQNAVEEMRSPNRDEAERRLNSLRW